MDCEEFFCARYFEDHQRGHRFQKVEGLWVSLVHQFLEDTKTFFSLFCSSISWPEESCMCSIYCPCCEQALCCTCALLHTWHVPFCDLCARNVWHQDELCSLPQDLQWLRGAFKVALASLQGEAAWQEEQREQLWERVCTSTKWLQQLVWREAEELWALL